MDADRNPIKAIVILKVVGGKFTLAAKMEPGG